MSESFHLLSDPVFELMASAVNAGDFMALLHAAITVPPRAHDIKVFESETHRIETRMAGGTGFGIGVPCENLTNSAGAADVGFDGWNGGRRLGVCPESI